MKKTVLTLILLSSVLLISCGNSGNKMSDSTTRESSYLSYSQEKEIADKASGVGGYADYDIPESETQSYTGNGGSASVSEYEKKVIKNAEITLDASDVTACYNEILAFVKENGGYEFSYRSDKYDEYVYVNAVIKILPQNLDRLMNFAGESGTLIASRIYSNDISAEYYDSVTRLSTLRKSLEKYYEFLESTTNVKDMLSVQDEINNLTMQIESYEGQIKYWNSIVDEATVTITINPIIPESPSIEQRDINWNTLSFDDMLYLLKRGFLGVINIIVTGLQWLVILFVSALPVIIIVSVIVAAAVLSRKRKRDKLPPRDDDSGDEK